jgi:DNA-binding NtrC family response regulator
VPPLRDLEEDRYLLLEYFSDFYARETGQKSFKFDPKAKQRWLDYHFPGNVRELRNIIIRLIAKYTGQTITDGQLASELDLVQQLTATDLPLMADENALAQHAHKHLQSQANVNLDHVLKCWEKAYVNEALKITHGNLSQAAKMLGINRTTLYSRIQLQEEFKD